MDQVSLQCKSLKIYINALRWHVKTVVFNAVEEYCYETKFSKNVKSVFSLELHHLSELFNVSNMCKLKQSLL